MARILNNWIESYLSYTEGTEPPKMMHFFAAVSALAGALRRHVWVDMVRFQWYPNFYVLFVAPPGVISKTTTMDHALNLLKAVPDIKFGPDVVTWEALTKKFAEAMEEFRYEDEYLPQSAITLASGEFGNLIDPRNQAMVMLYISLWDGRAGFQKETKMSGNDDINAPWINMIGCTTPSWIRDNFPESMVGGGFVSRCIFVYAEEKDKYVAWPDEVVNEHHGDLRAALIHDLEYISQNIIGPMTLSQEARDWGRTWYENLWREVAKMATTEQLQGYLARKQSHLVKLGMILSISEGDDRVIQLKHLQLAKAMLETSEQDASKVFGQIGQTPQAKNAQRMVEFVKRYGEVEYSKVYRYMISFFPDAREFEGILKALLESGLVRVKLGSADQPLQQAHLVYTGG